MNFDQTIHEFSHLTPALVTTTMMPMPDAENSTGVARVDVALVFLRILVNVHESSVICMLRWNLNMTP